MLLMFPLVVIALWYVIKPESDAYVNRLDSDNFIWTPLAKGTIVLFLFTVTCWILSSQLSGYFGLKKFDHMIAILITALAPAFGLLTWKELEQKMPLAELPCRQK